MFKIYFEERKIKNNKEDKDKVDLKTFYSNITQDQRFAKQQQLALAYYILIVHAAIFGFYEQIRPENGEVDYWVRRVFIIVVIIIAVLGYTYAIGFQKWLVKNRKGFKFIEDKKLATEEYLKVVRKIRGNKDISTGFFNDWPIFFGLIFIETTALLSMIYWFFSH